VKNLEQAKVGTVDDTKNDLRKAHFTLGSLPTGTYQTTNKDSY
jgi:hypothetical protein